MISLLANEDFYNAVSRNVEEGSVLTGLLMMVGITAIVALVFVAIMVVAAIWAERRVSGRIQVRRGPNRVGWAGILQGPADGIKLIAKEWTEPAGSDTLFFRLSPVLVFAGAFVGFVAVPFSHVMVVADFNVALFFILAVTSLETIGVLMGGWAANSKWSLLGAIREAVQVVSYEIPLALTAMIAIVAYGSMSLMDIQAAQGVGVGSWMNIFAWGIFRSPIFMGLGCIMFYVACLASCKRTPFDLPEGESELVAGYHTEYPGMGFGMMFFGEYASMYLMCVLCVLLFLGGSGFMGVENIHIVTIPLKQITTVLTLGFFPIDATLPFHLGFVILFAKTTVLYFVMLQLRWTLPRYRLDQVIDMCLKVLLPWALFCIVAQGFWTLAGLDDWIFNLFEIWGLDVNSALKIAVN
ncbi:NADH-quinone oxidoreductase subunit H [Planctomycetota bacterium]